MLIINFFFMEHLKTALGALVVPGAVVENLYPRGIWRKKKNGWKKEKTKSHCLVQWEKAIQVDYKTYLTQNMSLKCIKWV